MAARWPVLFRLYRAGGTLALPVLRRRIRAKHLAEGGPPARTEERFGLTSAPRPDGPVIWVHAVSIGEALSVLDLCKTLAEKADVLLTTTSVTSAALVAERLPDRVRHQFAPIDVAPCVTRFLDHWSPDLLVLTESEIWPVTLSRLADRDIPVALVNGRMSEKSAAGWARFAPRLAHAAFSRLSMIRAQDDESKQRFSALGARDEVLETQPSLKSAAPKLPVEAAALEAEQRWINGRPVWLAASTHEGEDDIALEAHLKVLQAQPDALLILAPRHPARADTIAGAVTAAGLTLARRSTKDPADAKTQVYLADTLGEMGLWYALANPVLMGGSLLAGIGGHNPMEPAQFGCTILTGPHFENAQDLFDALIADQAASVVTPAPDDIADTVLTRLSSPRSARSLAPPDAKPIEATARALLALF